MASQYAKASYTEVIDLQTTNGKTSIIGIHTPVGQKPYRRLWGFFNQFKKFRYKGISSLVMVPAANLPVDPLGLTGVVGTTDLMDPRDALNPILFHGCHGEALSQILDTIYSADEYVDSTGTNASAVGRNVSESLSESEITNSVADYINAYYRCLTDTSWKKYGIQNGVRLKHLHPLVHKLARNTPMLPTVAFGSQNAGQYQRVAQNLTTDRIETVGEQNVLSTSNLEGQVNVPSNVLPNATVWYDDSSSFRPIYAQEFTNGMTGLGWLPTATMVQTSETSNAIVPTALPKLFMGVLVLPPSYNVEQYFRCVIRHEFEFSEFTTSLGLMGFGGNSFTNLNATKTEANYYNWIDYTDAGAKAEQAKLEGVDSVDSSIDMIGGESTVVSDGVA